MLQLDSILIRSNELAEAERLTSAGGDVLDWRGVVPSHEGGEVTWREALVRLPADTAVRLGLIMLGEGLRESPDAAARLEGVGETTTAHQREIPVARTSSGVPIVAPRRHRSRRQRRALPREMAAHHRPVSDTHNTGLPTGRPGRGTATDTGAIAPSPQPARLGGILSENRSGAQYPSETQHTSKGEGQDIDAHPTGGH